MLIAEKFLIYKIGEINFPIPEVNGYVGYETSSKNKKSINFIDIKATSFKSNFIRYNFNFFTLEIDFNIGKNILTTRNIEIDYSNFIETLFEVKNKIINNEKFFVPSDKKELLILIWKSFLVYKEKWFVANVENIPSYFYDTINELITINIRIDYIEKAIEHIKNFDYTFYLEWEKHVNNSNYENHITWFYNFVTYGD